MPRKEKVEKTALELQAAGMLVQAVPAAEVAERLGVTEEEVLEIAKRPGVRNYMNRLKEKFEERYVSSMLPLVERVNGLMPKVLDTLEELNSGWTIGPGGEVSEVKHSDRIQAAKLLMQYSTDLRPSKEDAGQRHFHVHLAPKQLENMKNAMNEIGNSRIAALIEKGQLGQMKQ